MKTDTNEVELVYAKDIIPVLNFLYQPGVYYPKGYVYEWRQNLMDIWGKTNMIGLRKRLKGMNVLANPDNMWFTTKESAIKWANEACLKVVNPNFI